MAVIKVPRTPKSAFDPSRPPSGLIQAQIQHLEAAAGMVPQPGRRRTSRKARTEGQAAAYIAELTARIYARAAERRLAEPEVAVIQPPVPIAGTPTPTSTTRLRSAAPVRPARTPRARTSARTTRKTSRTAGKTRKARKARAASRSRRRK